MLYFSRLDGSILLWASICTCNQYLLNTSGGILLSLFYPFKEECIKSVGQNIFDVLNQKYFAPDFLMHSTIVQSLITNKYLLFVEAILVLHHGKKTSLTTFFDKDNHYHQCEIRLRLFYDFYKFCTIKLSISY